MRRIAGFTVATALLAASTGAAHAADTKPKPLDFTVRVDASPVAAQAPVTKWDAATRKWGVTLNLQQPDTRAANWNDIQAGAYYRITPSLRVGGAFAFGDQQPLPGPKAAAPEGVESLYGMAGESEGPPSGVPSWEELLRNNKDAFAWTGAKPEQYGERFIPNA
jgi:hypothetical protein